MKKSHRLFGITLVATGLCLIAAFVLWKARVRHILTTTPLPVTLNRMLLHESWLLPNWADIDDKVNVILFEGLPHQYYEPAALKTEEQQKPTIRIGGFPFYSEQLSLTEHDANRLLPVLMSPTSFKGKSNAAKACGGFHPDYALRLTLPETYFDILICFGCYEIRIVRPDGDTEFDLRSGPAEWIRALLERYRKNRPPFQVGAIRDTRFEPACSFERTCYIMSSVSTRV